MYREWIPDAKFYFVLEQIDADLAATAKEGGCGECGGVLHSARYPRRPRGGPDDLGEGYNYRLSFCCAKKFCRKRLTPASVRFLGRKVYLGAVVVVATVLRHGLTPVRMARLRALFGVSAKTVKRWRQFWQETLVGSEFWKVAKGHFMPQVDEAALPGSLLLRFAGTGAEPLAHLLRLLSPMTTGGLTMQIGSKTGADI